MIGLTPRELSSEGAEQRLNTALRESKLGCGRVSLPQERTLRGERVKRRLSAILATDVAGYSRLMGRDEAGTLARLKALRRELIDPTIAEHKGRIVKTTGDGMLVEFPSVVEAVACAVEFQRGMAERNAPVPNNERIDYRVGINLGDVIVEDNDIHGDGVNIAARLEALAEPGEVRVSGVVHDQVQGRLECSFEDTGEQKLKNIARPVRVYRIRDTPVISPSAADQTALPLPDKPSLAVLPFQNMTGDPEQEYFVDGMVEEITTAISRLPWLFVIARNSSFTYKGKAVDVKQVARELGVRYVLEGSVRKAGNRVRISGQLIDTATGAHIWADRFDAALDDVFELQDRVASSVVGAIEPKLRQSEIARAKRKPTESLDAYDLYLRALAEFHKFTESSVVQAIELSKRALAIDPSYAPAAAMLGRCLTVQLFQGWASGSEVARTDAVRLARQAIETGKDDPDTLSTSAETLSWCVGDHHVAEDAVDRALILNPNSVHAWRTRGYVLVRQNRHESALDAFHRAMRLSPLDPLGFFTTAGISATHLAVGQYPEAIEWADRSSRESPAYRPPIRYKVIALAHLGRIAEARAALSRELQLDPGLTITAIKAHYAAALPAELLAVVVDGYRKAGLPEE
jgi:adenylate cyclase